MKEKIIVEIKFQNKHNETIKYQNMYDVAKIVIGVKSLP